MLKDWLFDIVFGNILTRETAQEVKEKLIELAYYEASKTETMIDDTAVEVADSVLDYLITLIPEG